MGVCKTSVKHKEILHKILCTQVNETELSREEISKMNTLYSICPCGRFFGLLTHVHMHDNPERPILIIPILKVFF